MEGSKIDARISRTKNALRKSFITLLINNSIEKITVNELCQHAKVNRITFYNHYTDKYDFFFHIIQEEKKLILKELDERIPKEEYSKDIIFTMTTLCDIIADKCLMYKDLLLAIYTNKDNALIQYMVKNMIESIISENSTYLKTNNITNNSNELLVSYMTGGLCSMIFYWLSNQKKYSKEEFISNLKHMIKVTIPTK